MFIPFNIINWAAKLPWVPEDFSRVLRDASYSAAVRHIHLRPKADATNGDDLTEPRLDT